MPLLPWQLPQLLELLPTSLSTLHHHHHHTITTTPLPSSENTRRMKKKKNPLPVSDQSPLTWWPPFWAPSPGAWGQRLRWSPPEASWRSRTRPPWPCRSCSRWPTWVHSRGTWNLRVERGKGEGNIVFFLFFYKGCVMWLDFKVVVMSGWLGCYVVVVRFYEVRLSNLRRWS